MGNAYGIRQQEVFKFEDLEEDAKESAMNEYREGFLDYEWWECVCEDAKEIGKLMGIEIDNIYFSGFCSQGDGACFEGDYEYKKGSVKAIKDYAPLDTELHQIAMDLAMIQRPAFYGLTATVKQYGRYFSTNIDVYKEWHDYATINQEDAITETLRDYMHWIYKRLESEFDWLNSDEQIAESIEINEHLFLEDGTFI